MLLSYSKIDRIIIIKALIAGIVWWLTFYFIRKGLNKRNFKDDIDKKKEIFWWDGIYGGIATFVSVVVNQYLKKYYE